MKLVPRWQMALAAVALAAGSWATLAAQEPRVARTHRTAPVTRTAHAVKRQPDSYAYSYGYQNTSDYTAGTTATYTGDDWNTGYYHTMWGQPLALVVPPTANYQFDYGWGVGNTRLSPIFPQYMGPTMSYSQGGTGNMYRPTPYWPSDTTQFGVYYIRGPW